MEFQEILSAVTTVGFPIVMCGGMAYYVKYITDKNREQIADLNERHQEELSETVTALNNNTLAIQRLCDKLDREGISL